MKKKYIKYIILTAVLVFSAVCFIWPEQAENVARGWSLLINGLLLLVGV